MFKCKKCNKEFEINDFFNEYQYIKNNEYETDSIIYCPSCCEAHEVNS